MDKSTCNNTKQLLESFQEVLNQIKIIIRENRSVTHVLEVSVE
jgi:hypothetical protein